MKPAKKKRRLKKYEKMIGWLRYLSYAMPEVVGEDSNLKTFKGEIEKMKSKQVKKEWGVAFRDLDEVWKVWRLVGGKKYKTREEARVAKRKMDELHSKDDPKHLMFRVVCRCEAPWPISAPWGFAK